MKNMLFILMVSALYGGKFQTDKISCENSTGEICYEHALKYDHPSRESSDDDVSAYILYEIGCKKNYSKACIGQASIYMVGTKGIKRNPIKAFELYLKACENGDGEGCGNIGYAYYWGEGIEKSYANAKLFYEKGCNYKNAYSCFTLGEMYRDVKWVNKDYKKAFFYKEKSCELGYCMGCNYLARMYEIGQGVTQNKKKSAKLYAQSFECFDIECAKGNIKSCSVLDELRKKGTIGNKDRQTVIDMATKNCNEGRSETCATLGEMYHEGRGVDRDFFLSEKFYMKACDNGHLKSCENLGFTYYDNPKKKKISATLFKEACGKNNPRSCFMLGSMYIEGVGVTQDIQKAKTLIKQSCNYGYAEACSIYKKLKKF